MARDKGVIPFMHGLFLVLIFLKIWIFSKGFPSIRTRHLALLSLTFSSFVSSICVLYWNNISLDFFLFNFVCVCVFVSFDTFTLSICSISKAITILSYINVNSSIIIFISFDAVLFFFSFCLSSSPLLVFCHQMCFFVTTLERSSGFLHFLGDSFFFFLFSFQCCLFLSLLLLLFFAWCFCHIVHCWISGQQMLAFSFLSNYSQLDDSIDWNRNEIMGTKRFAINLWNERGCYRTFLSEEFDRIDHKICENFSFLLVIFHRQMLLIRAEKRCRQTVQSNTKRTKALFQMKMSNKRIEMTTRMNRFKCLPQKLMASMNMFRFTGGETWVHVNIQHLTFINSNLCGGCHYSFVFFWNKKTFLWSIRLFISFVVILMVSW